jgi:hypothetical protein
MDTAVKVTDKAQVLLELRVERQCANKKVSSSHLHTLNYDQP